MSELNRILCVDDEENILKAIQRSLRKSFEIHTAGSGPEGLRVLAAEGPFQVVVSDMRMPEMNGAQFLRLVREQSPDTVRLLLTGFADLDTVVTAVNEGYIYRFISKPCAAGVLLEAINDAVAQHNLITSERVLLEQTLRGSIHALTEILSMANPAAFGRGTRIRQLAVHLGQALDVGEMWQLEVAAMLSQIGCITLPDEIAMKWYTGGVLDDVERQMVARMPEMSRQVLGNIPRLEPVLEILEYQTKNFDGSGSPESKLEGEEIPLGARILKVAVRCEELQGRGYSPSRVLDTLHAAEGWYDPRMVKAYQTIAAQGNAEDSVRGVTMHELRTGMVFTEDVKALNGLLLVAKGQEVTISLLERIQNYERTTGLQIPMWVTNPEGDEAETDAEAGVTTGAGA